MTAPVVEAGQVIDLLAAVFATLMVGELDDVEAFNGPDTGAGWAKRALTVGDPMDDDQQPVETDQRHDGPGRREWVEHAVACVAWSYAGTTDVVTQRGEAEAIMAAVRALFRRDPTLGGRVARAQLGEQRWGTASDEDGAVEICSFTVAVLVLP